MEKLKKAAKAYKDPDFLNSKDARPIRILAEYYEPLQRLERNKVNATIVFFGSARTFTRENAQSNLEKAESKYKKDNTVENESRLVRAKANFTMSRYYEESVELAKQITLWTLDKNTQKQKYYICSGGGPGIMEAANKGAQLAGGKSLGLNISLPLEQFPNPFITDELNFEFHYFFMRKYWFLYLAKAIVVFPGGFGTMDEMMEVLTLIQTKKVYKRVPILVYGSEYWNEVINLEAMQKWGTISVKDLDLFKFVDTVEDALNYLKQELKE